MKVKDLQQFLGSFTKGSEAVQNAVIFVEVNGKVTCYTTYGSS